MAARGRTVVWKRVDVPGLEYAEVSFEPFSLLGEVVVVEAEGPLHLSYRIAVNADGATERVTFQVRRAGTHAEHLLVRSSAGSWSLDGAPQPSLEGLLDVDLSVTPATNTLCLRRLRLALGQAAEVTGAWVRFPPTGPAVSPLRQVYRRTGPTRYDYEAPDLAFTAELACDEDGVVRRYTGLWEAV